MNVRPAPSLSLKAALMIDEEPLAAGGFSVWLASMQGALQDDTGSDVPCGPCTACCTSSQFVHISPDEVDTLAHVPAQLLFPAPRLPKGNVLLGYDQLGRCPMLGESGCSIYEHRPRTCRTYDCRIFPATGIEPGDADDGPIARRARRWQFDFPSGDDRVRHDAVRAAATSVHERQDQLGEIPIPANATQGAVLAIRIHQAFLGRDRATQLLVVVDPSPKAIREVLSSRRDRRTTAG